ncbi:hypothetical protein [Streptomyces pseudovenezuelae]|uniref:Uncharacterized protein n=1 Tax=Streptomyces pseudovenezuelae TaxID=67350 RepID=A0ABT6LVM8_9ACTN|nr:hypothetical protein [Streptomyces pseudovenezuelae]MDH6219731.1 hypothetical protein [Streptomyces pseudovenezuelae]
MTTDMSPRPPVPELWQALDEAAHGCTPTTFPIERIMRRSEAIKRRRRWAAVGLSAALLVPVGVEVVSLSAPAASHTVTGADPQPASPSAGRETPRSDSEVRIVRQGQRVQAGLGVWYLLKPTEVCDAQSGDEQPICVGDLDVNQPGTVPVTENSYPLPQGVVHILAYTGKVPAARITMTEDGRTTVLPIVRLAGRPAYVSTYAVSAPEDPGQRTQSPRKLDGPVFRVYGADGKELASVGGW